MLPLEFATKVYALLEFASRFVDNVERYSFSSRTRYVSRKTKKKQMTELIPCCDECHDESLWDGGIEHARKVHFLGEHRK